VERKQPIKLILLHACNAMVANQQLMVWYESLKELHAAAWLQSSVIDAKMLVWDENKAQILATAQLQCFCGRQT